MNEDISLNKNSAQSLCNSCLYNPHCLIVQKKIVSQLVAFFLLLAFFIFALGYFLGKKKLAEDFSHIVEQANFSDQINFALTSLYEQENNIPKNQKDQKELGLPTEPEQTLLQKQSATKDFCPLPDITQGSSMRYAAELFGGTQKAVHLFAQRLAKKGIQVEVRSRTSKSASGKPMIWYQAVTKHYDNRNERDAIVAMIKKLEKINNVTDVEFPT